MLGTDDLKITPEWKFRFYDYGKSIHSQLGTIYVDIGSKLDFGVIDHHLKDTIFHSSSSAIAKNSHFVLNHLLGPANTTYYKGLPFAHNSFEFIFGTHKSPDWDGMASFYLCDTLIRMGELPSDDVTKALCEATDLIDQGFVRCNGEVKRPFLLYLMLSHDRKLKWEEQILLGNKMIKYIVDLHSSKKKTITASAFLEPFEVPEFLSVYAKQLEDDRSIFLEDMKSIETFEVFLPTPLSTSEKVHAIAFQHHPKSVLTKYWVREETSYDLLIIPFMNPEKGFHKTIISVDPKNLYSLPCLGLFLEEKETEKRLKLGKEYKRGGFPRFEKEYCDNDDPWYDGRGHNYTIIDSPSNDTILAYSEVLETIRMLYASPDSHKQMSGTLDAFISYRRDGGSSDAWAIRTMLEQKEKKTFLDVSELIQGSFNDQLLTQLSRAKNVVLILSPGALDRCRNADDWVAREIREARQMNKNIIPVLKDGFVFPSEDAIPDDLKFLPSINGVGWSHEHFHSVITKILQFMR